MSRKIQDTIELISVDGLDYMPIIDKSDTSGATAGTGKHVKMDSLSTWMFSGDKTISGSWSFTSPITSVSPTSDNHVVIKSYVDNLSPWRVGGNPASAKIDEPGYENSVNSVATAAIGGGNVVGTASGGIWDAYGSMALGADNEIINGYYNFTSGYSNSVKGTGHCVFGSWNEVKSGNYHFVSGAYNTIENTSSSNTSIVGSYIISRGQQNIVCGNILGTVTTKRIIAEGSNNFVVMTLNDSSTNGFVTGNFNTVMGYNHGITNTSASYNAIIGGEDHLMAGNYTHSAIVGGSDITIIDSHTVYVPRLEVVPKMTTGSEIIMTSPNGTNRYKLQIDNSGVLSITLIP